MSPSLDISRPSLPVIPWAWVVLPLNLSLHLCDILRGRRQAWSEGVARPRPMILPICPTNRN